MELSYKKGFELVKEVLTECVDNQLRANLGGIVGGEENEEFARQDLKRYGQALDWFNKNVSKNKTNKND